MQEKRGLATSVLFELLPASQHRQSEAAYKLHLVKLLKA